MNHGNEVSPRILPDRIATRRLVLRPPQPADAMAIFDSYAQDPAVCRYLDWAPHESPEVTRNFITECIEARTAGKRLPYVIVDPDGDSAIGMFEARIGTTTVSIGYVLARSRWGSGLMPEAIGAVAEACLSRPEIFRVQAFCDADNHGSARALEKAGFMREGRLERYAIQRNVSSEPRACLIYARWR